MEERLSHDQANALFAGSDNEYKETGAHRFPSPSFVHTHKLERRTIFTEVDKAVISQMKSTDMVLNPNIVDAIKETVIKHTDVFNGFVIECEKWLARTNITGNSQNLKGALFIPLCQLQVSSQGLCSQLG